MHHDLEATTSQLQNVALAVQHDWTSTSDQDNPLNWPVRKRWKITLVAVFATFLVMVDGTMLTVAHEDVSEAFDTSDEEFPNSYWPVATWTLGGALLCLIVLPLLEDFGVRPGFLWTYGLFVISLVPQAVTPNFAILLIGRFFSGGCASVLANAAAGVISDVWEDERSRSIPMSLYISAYLIGLSIGPIVGAVIVSFLAWRWVLYIQLIMYTFISPIFVLCLKETRGAVILRQRALRLEDKVAQPRGVDYTGLLRKLCESIRRPAYMLLTEPVLLVFALWSAFAVGTVYLFTQSLEYVYAELYDWDAVQAGYVQGAVVLGMCVGGASASLSKKLYLASGRRNTECPGIPILEARLYLSVPGSVIGVTGGMFVYGWTSFQSMPWIAPTVGLAMVGCGIVIVVLAAADYVVDAYADFAASAVAALVLVENVVAAFLPMASTTLYTSLGLRWASSVLAFASLALSCAPVVLIIWGSRIRARSPLMKNLSTVLAVAG